MLYYKKIMNSNYTKWTMLLLVIVGSYTCSTENEPDITTDPDLIFEESYKIDIPSYTYFNGDTAISFSGDSLNILGVVDTLSNKPVFKWAEIPARFILAALSTNPIQTEEGEIINTNDIIWRWNTGMQIEEDNIINYSEGKPVINGEIIEDENPAPLNRGLYYFGIWGWDKDGKKVNYSSIEVNFYVNN